AARTGDGAGLTAALARATTRLPFQRWAPFLSNHDQTRAMSVLAGNRDRARVAATALLTLPGLPFMYYGEEIGMQGEKPDERIRTPMQWNGQQNAGFTGGQPWEALQSDAAQVNVAAENANPASLLNEYRQMIRLHTSTPALAQGTFTPLDVSGTPGVSLFLRKAGDSAVLVVLNFGEQPLTAATASTSTSDLMPGQYQLRPLHGASSTGTITVGEGGSVTDMAVPPVAALTGAVFAIQP
ncbi:MAG TPA: alpha-amylase family glycosyl hydrolase, partial [Roseiflexaceae bacterium]|nr:alpha-amylase family glycosyl hydrolase [Roseiflexaceae bacterium]